MTDAPKKAKKRRRRKGAKAKAIPSREVSDGVDDTVGVESEEHHELHPGLGVYVAVFVALLALTGATVAVAYVDLGVLAAPVALAIASVKASLVIFFFMHLKYESRLIGLYAASGFAMLLVMFVFTLAEMRGRPSQPGPDPLSPAGALEPGPPAP